MESAAGPEHEVEAQLERVPASPTFTGAERSLRLLRFNTSLYRGELEQTVLAPLRTVDASSR